MNEPKNTRKPQDSDKYIVRFPEGMREKIAEAAKANNRSMNAEIVARLQSTFETRTFKIHGKGSSAEAEAIAAEVVRQLELVLPGQTVKLRKKSTKQTKSGDS